MHRKTNGGFTLIELLVVIAIIAILAALLYPMMMRAKAMAQSGKCQAHERQMYGALMLYVEDFNGKLPNFQFLSWRGTTHLYHKYLKNNDITICIRNKQAYGYNECLLSRLTNRLYIPPKIMVRYAAGVWESGGRGYGRPVGDIVYPSKTPVFFCSVPLHMSPDGVYRGYGWGADDAINKVRQPNLHNDGMNYCFIDGHVKWSLPEGDGVFWMHITGWDYDGDGTIGGNGIMR